MKSIMIQFHATPEELVEYLNSVRCEFGLTATIMVLKPFSLKEVKEEFALSSIAQGSDVSLMLTDGRPNIDVSSSNKFYDANPGVIAVDFGGLTEEGLHESAFSFMGDEKDKIAVANKLAAKLKKITKAGAMAVNPLTGAEANIRTHRYTKGAKEKYDQGIKILPVAGNSYFRLPD